MIIHGGDQLICGISRDQLRRAESTGTAGVFIDSDRDGARQAQTRDESSYLYCKRRDQERSKDQARSQVRVMAFSGVGGWQERIQITEYDGDALISTNEASGTNMFWTGH
jgi:hypothetical protein